MVGVGLIHRLAIEDGRVMALDALGACNRLSQCGGRRRRRWRRQRKWRCLLGRGGTAKEGQEGQEVSAHGVSAGAW